eukprot:1191395-Prorocentrum_minimum.AAC.13
MCPVDLPGPGGALLGGSSVPAYTSGGEGGRKGDGLVVAVGGLQRPRLRLCGGRAQGVLGWSLAG